MKKDSVLVKVVAVAATIAVDVAVLFFGSAAVFTKKSSESLGILSEMQVLRFESQIKSEIKLVLQMASSPVIKEYMENPEGYGQADLALAELEQYQNSFLSKSSFWISTADRKFMSDGKYAYTLDPEDPAQYWYKMTLKETEVYNFNINYNPDLKNTFLWINAVVRNDSGVPVAIAGTGIPIGNFIDEIYSSLESEPGVNMFMYNSAGEITGAADKTLVEKKALISSVIPSVAAAGEVKEEKFIPSLKGSSMFVPIELIGWTLVLYKPFTLEAFCASCYIPVGLILLAVFVFFMVLMAFRIFMPLNALCRMVTQISSGNADLTRRIDMLGRTTIPVIKKLVEGFNFFIEKIHELVSDLKESEKSLEESRAKLKDCTADTLDSIGGILTSIDTFGSGMDSQSASVSDTAGAVNEISSNISSLNKMISTQSESVSEASAAVEQMLGNIMSVNSSVEKLGKSFEELENDSAEGVAKQDEVNTRISQIQNESMMLQEANLVISSIAEQTNLLAMNAAIEAAHAGEAGKGFSVVADEIRKLSETSSEQSKSIGQKLRNIQNSISEMVSVSEDSAQTLRNVSDKIKDTNTLVQQIENAMAEQEVGSKQINGALDTLRDSSVEVKTASSEMEAGNKSILDEIHNLQDTSCRMQDGMDKMKADGRRMNDTQKALSVLSDEMDNAIRVISEHLNMFNV